MAFLRRYERLTIDITRIEVCTKVYSEKRYLWKGGNTERDIHERRYTRREGYSRGSTHMGRYTKKGVSHGEEYTWKRGVHGGGTYVHTEGNYTRKSGIVHMEGSTLGWKIKMEGRYGIHSGRRYIHIERNAHRGESPAGCPSD